MAIERAGELLAEIATKTTAMSPAFGDAARVYVIDGLGGKWEITHVEVGPVDGVGEAHIHLYRYPIRRA